jgi:hypothetical protein
MLDLASFDIEPEIIYGRKTKTNRNPPFEWFDRPNSCLPSGINENSAQIMDYCFYLGLLVKRMCPSKRFD